MTRVLLIGKKGQLGWELHRTLATLGELIAVDYPEIDLGQPETGRNLIRQIQPQVIVNAAAYTAVDQAETEHELARKINAIAPGVLAEEARRLNALFIHYSTDYVFDGAKGTTYTETDVPNPLNFYGLSKLEGEQKVENMGGAYLIFRTSWLYSLRQQSGFVSKVLQWARQQETLRLVNDQISNPTWARMLAEVTAQVLAQGVDTCSERKGLYHLTGSGFTSRFEWAKSILALDPNQSEQTVKELLPALTSEFPTPARRPLFSAMDCNKFTIVFGLYIPLWEDSLRLAMNAQEDITNNLNSSSRSL
jgi:dTDP-4-dehydrorhamnose reductase